LEEKGHVRLESNEDLLKSIKSKIGEEEREIEASNTPFLTELKKEE